MFKLKKIPIEQILKLLLRNNTYTNKEMLPSSVNNDLNRSVRKTEQVSTWNVGPYSFVTGKDVTLLEKYQKFQQALSEDFARLFIVHLQQKNYAALTGFVHACGQVLGKEKQHIFMDSNSACNVVSKMKEPNCVIHSMSVHTQVFQASGLEMENIGNSPWKIEFKFTYKEGKFYKTVNIEQWPKFRKSTINDKIGNPNLEVTKSEAQEILEQTCCTDELRASLCLLDQMFNGENVVDQPVEVEVPSFIQLKSIIDKDGCLSPNDKILFFLDVNAYELAYNLLDNNYIKFLKDSFTDDRTKASYVVKMINNLNIGSKLVESLENYISEQKEKCFPNSFVKFMLMELDANPDLFQVLQASQIIKSYLFKYHADYISKLIMPSDDDLSFFSHMIRSGSKMLPIIKNVGTVKTLIKFGIFAEEKMPELLKKREDFAEVLTNNDGANLR